ncbi:MAG: thermonuclease family protein [Acidimicrobiia bacterium]
MFRRRTILLLAAVGLLSTLFATPAVAAGPEGSVGVVDATTGKWFLRDWTNGQTTSFYFGDPGDLPFMGDWDCDGVDSPGLYRQSDGYVYLRNTNSQGIADIQFFFGDPGDIPIAGDFNGDGCDTVSIYRPSEARFYIINELGSDDGGLGAADFSFDFGDVGDKPFAGDLDFDGIDEIALHRETTGYVYYRNTLTTGVADNEFFYGNPGDEILAENWGTSGVEGADTVGLSRASVGKFFLRYSNSQGSADAAIYFGNETTTAVSGNFGDLPGGDDPPISTVGLAVVTGIVDGETFDVTIGDVAHRVRIIGIDAPAAGECYYDDAKDHLTELVGGKTVTLSKDTSEADSSGRLLRYVRAPLVMPAGTVDVNLSLLTLGSAIADPVPPDTARQTEFAVTEKVAMDADRGLWGACT